MKLKPALVCFYSLLFTFLLFCFESQASFRKEPPEWHEKGAVISKTEIDLDTVKRLYLGQQRDLIAVNLAEGNAARSRFETQVIGRSSAQLKAHWARLVFTGRAWDLGVYKTDEEVLRFVENSPNGVGYISDASLALKKTGIHIVGYF